MKKQIILLAKITLGFVVFLCLGTMCVNAQYDELEEWANENGIEYNEYDNYDDYYNDNSNTNVSQADIDFYNDFNDSNQWQLEEYVGTPSSSNPPPCYSCECDQSYCEPQNDYEDPCETNYDPCYCDGDCDDEPTNTNGQRPEETIKKRWYLDNDGDGYYSQVKEAETSPGTNWKLNLTNKDCDDTDSNRKTQKDCDNCTKVCKATEKLDTENCECVPKKCNIKKGYLHESAFKDKKANFGDNTTIAKDNFRDDKGDIITTINCNIGKIEKESRVEVIGTKEEREYTKSDGTKGKAMYFPIEYLDCPKGNHPENKDYDSNKPCSDCTHGNPVPNPQIQAQLTACGTQGGMFGFTRGVLGGCSSIEHGGVDIANELGEPVYAMFDGTASLASQGNGATGAGFYVIITSTVNGDTITSLYFHLEDSTRVSGAVKAGDIIGYQGTSGNLANGIAQGTTESHVHIKVKENGTTVDPLEFFKTQYNGTTGEVTSTGCN